MMTPGPIDAAVVGTPTVVVPTTLQCPDQSAFEAENDADTLEIVGAATSVMPTTRPILRGRVQSAFAGGGSPEMPTTSAPCKTKRAPLLRWCPSNSCRCVLCVNPDHFQQPRRANTPGSERNMCAPSRVSMRRCPMQWPSTCRPIANLAQCQIKIIAFGGTH
jgi:hypothetical protein